MRISSRLLPAACLAAAFCGSTGISLLAANRAETIRRTAWSFDRSEISWYDSNKAEEKKKQGIINEMFGWAEYDVVIPSDSWYELWEAGGVAGWSRDLFVDGKAMLSLAISEKEDVANRPGEQEGWYKECNLWLTGGKHRLRFRRLSFPGVLPSAFELVPAAGRPTCSVFAEKEGFDVLRVGEQYKIKVTAGATKSDLRYKIVLKSLLASPEMLPAGEVTFTASRQPGTKTVAIDCAKEGVYQVVAKMDGKLLRPSEFRGGQFAVVDVAEKLCPDDRKTIIHDIDCVTNTDLGRPIDPATFFECNGKTRISASKAGKYRESNDCTGPGVEEPAIPGDPRSYSGFAYALNLPDDSAVYLLEMDYPDDDRRSVTVPISFLSEDKSELLNGSYSGKSWETGGIFPLSWKMNAHRMVFWAVSKKMNVGILGQQIGHRAAASRIRVYKFGGKLPVARAANPSGRIFCHWYEEGDSLKFVVNSNGLYGTLPEIAADFVTLDRWSRLARYSGMNAISGFGVSYQGVFYRTKVLEGLFGRSYDACRLAALFCEKYGMKYVPEIFGSNATLEQTIRGRSPTPDDLYPMSRQGVKVGPGVDVCNFNALHPLVQDFWVEAFGELADKLRDSPAFAGVTVRADAWCYNGFFTLPSLHWGYSDWTMAQFQRHIGVNVPGKAGDASRYAERYKFLTAPDMIGKWNEWRCANINAYHKKIRDRLRGNRDDIFFGVAGDAVSDAINVFPDDPREVWRGAGVDLDKLGGEPGIAIIPTGSYGARNTTESEQANYDTFLNPASKAIGFGHPRAFAAYMIYHELGARMPYDKLGVKAKNYYYCSAVDAGGRNSLEKFAVVLADQDSSFLRDGGNSYVEGDPAVWRPWFAEFEALPAKPFTPLEMPGIRLPPGLPTLTTLSISTRSTANAFR